MRCKFEFDELRQRLEREGKSPAEIDEAIYAYVGPKGSTKRSSRRMIDQGIAAAAAKSVR